MKLFEIEDNQAKIKLNVEIYPLVVIQKTVSNYLENMYVKLEKEDKNILVNLFLKDNKENIKELVGNFYNELLVEALRYNIGVETKEIRELIVGRALYTTCIELDENREEKIEDDMTSEKTFQKEEYNLEDIAVIGLINTRKLKRKNNVSIYSKFYSNYIRYCINNYRF